MAGEIEARLKALDLVLPAVPGALANYVPFLHLDRQLFISGQLPMRDGSIAVAGKLGAGVSIDQGEDAARICLLNILAQAKAALGDLDRIVQCMRLNGFVNAAPDFVDHPKVINGASNLIVEILGDKGRHTRIAVGCSSLPLGAAVEIDAIFAVDYQSAHAPMTRDALEWLKRPIAHRGLHDQGRGLIENSASAIAAAIAKGYAIEVDLQCAADGLPVVFHDSKLDRLTAESGPVAARPAAALCAIPLRGSDEDRILSLEGLLAQVDGRVPLVLEVKSTWGRDPRYEASVAAILASYRGHVAVMSFDPDCVAAFRRAAPALPRGLISERFENWSDFGALRRFAMRHLLFAAIARPNFIAYDIEALPALAPAIARRVFRLPLLTWTVRSEADKARAEEYADAMIFEGVAP